MQCPYARQVWFGCLLAAGINVVEPRSNNTWESWWAATRGLISSRSRRDFDTLAILIAWSIWKLRNARAFGNMPLQLSPTLLVERIKVEFKLWELARLGGRHPVPRE
jgi:hypothetical protein